MGGVKKIGFADVLSHCERSVSFHYNVVPILHEVHDRVDAWVEVKGSSAAWEVFRQQKRG